MQIIFEQNDVTILSVQDTPVAMLAYRGDRTTFGETSEVFRN